LRRSDVFPFAIGRSHPHLGRSNVVSFLPPLLWRDAPVPAGARVNSRQRACVRHRMYVSSSKMSSGESSLSVIAFPFSAKVSTSQPGCFLAAGGCVPQSCKKELRVRASPSRAFWIVLVSVCDVRVLRQQRIRKVGWSPILWWVRVPRARLFQQVGMLF